MIEYWVRLIYKNNKRALKKYSSWYSYVTHISSPCPLFQSREWYWDGRVRPPLTHTQTHTSDNTEGHIYYDTVCNSKCFLRPDWLTVRPARSRKPLMAFSCSWGLLRSRRTCSKALAFVCSVFRVQMASWGERKMFEDGINNLQERISEWKDEDQSDLESDRCFVSSAHVRR